MAENVKDLILRLTLENDQLKKEVKNTKDEIGKMNKNMEKGQAGVGKLINAFKGLVATVGIIKGIQKALGAVQGFNKFQQSVQAMEAQFGVSSDKIIKKLKEVSDGTLSNAAIVESANRAMALNVTKDIDEMAKLMEVARVRGRAMGLDTQQAFSDLVTGIGRGSPMILDNLGIITKGWAEEAKAAGKAMDAQFILNKVLADGAKILKETGELTLTDAERTAKLAASMEDLGVKVGEAFNPLIQKVIPALGVAIDKTGELVKVLFNLDTNRDQIKSLNEEIKIYNEILEETIAKEGENSIAVQHTALQIQKLTEERDKLIGVVEKEEEVEAANFQKKTARIEAEKAAAEARSTRLKTEAEEKKRLEQEFEDFKKAQIARIEEAERLAAQRRIEINAAALGAIQTAEQTAFAITQNRRNAELDQFVTQKNRELAKLRENESLSKAEKISAEKNIQNEIRRARLKAFKADKRMKIIQIQIASALAVMQAFAQLGPIGGAIATIPIGAAQIAQTAIVASQSPPAELTQAFQNGGVISGLNDRRAPGNEDGFIAAQNGESVLNRQATATLGADAIAMLNKGMGVSPNVTINVSGGDPRRVTRELDNYFRQFGTSKQGVSI